MPTPPLLLAVVGVLAAAAALAGCATGTTPNAEITPKTQVNNPALATLLAEDLADWIRQCAS